MDEAGIMGFAAPVIGAVAAWAVVNSDAW